MSIKKKLTMGLIAVLAFAAIGGTMAYFTDADEAVNEFTVGSVDIELLESQYYTNVDKGYDDDAIRESAAGYSDYLAKAGENVVPGREFMKAMYIDNIGDNPAYVRIRVQVTPDQFASFYFYENTTALENDKMTKTIVGTTPNGPVTYANVAEAKADTTWTMLEYTYTYTEVLEPGDLTDLSPVWKFQMKDGLDNADVANLNTEIPVFADAIQAEGFADAAAAFAAFEAQE